MENLFKIASLIHTIQCKKTHELGKCEFYHEEEMPDKWSYHHHLIWLSEAREFQRMSRLSEEELVKTLDTIISSLSTISSIISDNETLKGFTKRAITLLLNPASLH